MPGYFKEIIDTQNDDSFTFDCIQDMEEAEMALEDCHSIIFALAGNDTEVISNICRVLAIDDPWIDLPETHKSLLSLDIKHTDVLEISKEALSLLKQWKLVCDTELLQEKDLMLETLSERTEILLLDALGKELGIKIEDND